MLVFGCARSRAAAEQGHPKAQTAAQRDRHAEARSLALAVPSGNNPADLRLRKLAALVQTQPKRAASFIELGRAWVDKARDGSDPGFYLNANACADVALSLSPDDPLALDLRLLVLLNDHEFRAAKQLAESLLNKRPDSVTAWGSLSDALLELGEHEAAERAAANMLDLKPNLPSYARASYLRWLRGDQASALELARLAIDSSDDARRPEARAWIIVQAAQLFWHAGDLAGADAGFQKALEAQPDYAPALVGRGRVALARGDAAAAGTAFGKAFEQSPLTETAWLLAQARSQSGDDAGARAAYAAAEREGRRADPRALSLMWATENRNVADALTLAEREHERRADIYTEDALAFALYRNQRFEDAAQVIERARRLDTPDARLLFHEGLIRLALKQTPRGRELLQRALARNPHFDEISAREARKLLGQVS
ncbi:MAG: tetratricopeptide repeat protein [Polyangiaceae bacterium]